MQSNALKMALKTHCSSLSLLKIDHRKISSTNTLERLNVEIRRRSRVVGIFPSMSSYIRLISSYLLEYEEDWQTGRSYINREVLARQRIKLKLAA